VLEVIETVNRVSGVDFKVGFAGRRVGDPNFDDLRTIVWYALAWERNLSTRRPLRSPNSSIPLNADKPVSFAVITNTT
jgi:hypothetical protein